MTLEPSSRRPLSWLHQRPVTFAAATVVMASLATGLAPTAAAATTTTACSSAWGSTAKSVARSSAATTTALRAGRHTCFDRLVIDGASWARVSYVNEVRMDGSGQLVPLRGAARLQINTTTGFNSANGTVTYGPANRREAVDVRGFPTFRQVAGAGDFEGQLTLGVGVRARLPFRVFVITTADRRPHVVVDVAHSW